MKLPVILLACSAAVTSAQVKVLDLAGRPVDPLASAQSQKAKGATELPRYLNTAPNVAYVGSKACAQCHGDVWDSFSQTDMGRSMSVPEAASELQKLKNPITVYDKVIDRYFKVFRQGNEINQSEFALDASGRKIFEHVEKIAYSVGAGENGFSYLIDRGGYLFQAPLSFYSRTGTWDLSPAHELGFTRPIEEGCIACHSGRARPVPNRQGLYRQPEFSELAIGCENCHGPGELHVKAHLRSDPLPEGPDLTIVNPARLPGRLADNICMSCHEKGDAEVLQPGKTYLDFRPGTALDETLAIFKVPLGHGTEDASPLLNHYFLMISSKCFRSSGGRLSCLSSHEPNGQPTAAEAPSYYRRRCMQCHSTGSCSLPFSARLRTAPPDDCVGCHMPKKALALISHSALTDHRIPARLDEPFPIETSQADPSLPGLIHLTSLPGMDNPVPPLTLLSAYAELASQDSAYRLQYERVLAQVAPAESSNPIILELLARDALDRAEQNGLPGEVGGKDKQKELEVEAAEDLARAIRLGSNRLADYELLAQLLARAGHFREAILILDRGIALAPFTPALYPLQSECQSALGNKEEAIETLHNGLRLFPEDGSMRNMLKKIEPGAH